MRTLRLLIAARKQVGSPADARQIRGGRGISRFGRFERCKLLISGKLIDGTILHKFIILHGHPYYTILEYTIIYYNVIQYTIICNNIL